MAYRFLKPKIRTLIRQKISLEQTYSGLIDTCDIFCGELRCIIYLQPSMESEPYLVKITYKYTDRFPKVWLLQPKVEKVNGKYPHHIYEWDNKGHPRLCVYYPGYKEWNPNMDIARSFIPWIVTWLNTYEYWLITGQWIYDESPQPLI